MSTCVPSGAPTLASKVQDTDFDKQLVPYHSVILRFTGDGGGAGDKLPTSELWGIFKTALKHVCATLREF